MIINKVTIGFVTQQFDTETRKFVGQEFTCGDDTCWENRNGERLDPSDDTDAAAIFGEGGVDEPYLNYEMVQPAPNLFNPGDRVLVTPTDGPGVTRNEFQGVVLRCDNHFVQVKDADDQVTLCDLTEVKIIK